LYGTVVKDFAALVDVLEEARSANEALLGHQTSPVLNNVEPRMQAV